MKLMIAEKKTSKAPTSLNQGFRRPSLNKIKIYFTSSPFFGRLHFEVLVLQWGIILTLYITYYYLYGFRNGMTLSDFDFLTLFSFQMLKLDFGRLY